MQRQHQVADAGALETAAWIHAYAQPIATFLFGSRARGDYHENSDTDVLIITERPLTDGEMRSFNAKAESRPGNTGNAVQVVAMTKEEFGRRRKLTNNLAWTIQREGIAVMGTERLNHAASYGDDNIDWDQVETDARVGQGAADLIKVMKDGSQLEAGEDENFGYMCHSALERSYKAVLGSRGIEYLAGGPGGHGLDILADLCRENGLTRADGSVPGEELTYLKDFVEGAAYAVAHISLDRYALADRIPDITEEIQTWVQQRPGRPRVPGHP